ncbi:DsbA family protein [Arthrobacter sp. UYCu712]|uniref:DsbA family oxidoreductase n=1 Tax=Arthrobacter sp. UYCu712 TaxID=3156340 RepID=UPI0033980CEF
MSIKVEVFVDYVCPFCFLIEGAIRELKRDRDVEVSIRPFELRPEPVPTLRPEDEYLPRIWNDSVYPMARRVGIDVTLPSISPQPRTEKAFMVLQLAEERGKAEEYSEAMFEAFFQDDRDIGEDDVIIDVAAGIGLDRTEVAEALTGQERRARQKTYQDHAVNTVGIQAVPGIVIAGQLVRGVPSASRMKKVVDQITGQLPQPGGQP